MSYLLRFLPKNHISFLIGKLLSIRLPFGFSKLIIRLFIWYYKVDYLEAKKSLDEFNSLNEFFTRELKDKCRKIEQGVVSPVDGSIEEFGVIEEDRIVQIKGKEYRLGSFLEYDNLASEFKNGFFITIYLAPYNYHRIHSHIDGEIIRTIQIPGNLWPVNNNSVRNIDNLFSQNERIISVFVNNNKKSLLVKVGALNVGNIKLSFDMETRTNRFNNLIFKDNEIRNKSYNPHVSLKAGQEVGYFSFGSTVVLLFENGSFTPSPALKKGPVKMGQSIGELTNDEKN